LELLLLSLFHTQDRIKPTFGAAAFLATVGTSVEVFIAQYCRREMPNVNRKIK
jgi:hypothetical protein